MIFPEGLWLPSLKDTLAQFAPGVVHRQFANTHGLASFQADILRVPGDQILILTSAVLVIAGGAAVSPVAAAIRITDETSTATTEIDILSTDSVNSRHNVASGVVAGDFRIQWSGQVILLPKQNVSINASYSGVAASNNVQAFCSGIFVPRGNAQFG